MRKEKTVSPQDYRGNSKIVKSAEIVRVLVERILLVTDRVIALRLERS